jgi:pyruvate dehydrogenase E2 component (dihydrolipoamide acetyltransferase)
MAQIISMRKMSDTMSEGVVASWLVKVGDKIKSGDVIAEVETDKATMEFENFDEGTVLALVAEPGKAIAIGAPMMVIGNPGEDYSALLSSAAAPTSTPAPAPVAETAPVAPTPTPAPAAAPVASAPVSVPMAPVATASDDLLKASPLARRLAEERGINIGMVNGSGDGGRIVKRDIDYFNPANAAAALAAQAQAPMSTTTISLPAFVGEEKFEEIPVSQMRKVIAARLAESMFTAPHFYLTMEIRMDQAAKAREAINAVAPVKVSFNDMVVKASALALKKHPKINSSWLGDKIRINHHVNIGVAMAVEEGLLVPVVRFADGKSLSHIAAEVKDFSGKAKAKKLQPSDWAGNTFTISNLGMFGIEEFTAIINPPDACILAVGAIKETVIVEKGEMKPGKVMKVTLSCDHRVVDGASGSEFLQTLKAYLENPVTMLA